MATDTLNGHAVVTRQDVVTLQRVLDALDYEVNEQQAYGADEDQFRDIANAADNLRDLLRRWGEVA